MKFHRLFFAALVLFTMPIFAQNGSTTFFHKNGAGWWTFGIDGGLAYQSSDVRTAWNGGGGGITLGKNLIYRSGGLLSFDLRGRLLFDRSFGANHRRSIGIQYNDALNGSDANRLDYARDLSAPLDSTFVFANYRTTMFEGGLEGVVTLNRLRERTGLVVNFFGGIGLDWYNTRIDQADANGNTYFDKYLTINKLGARREVISQLQSARDGTFETEADGFRSAAGRLGFMPGLGVEVGFQVTPRFVIGVGHKVTFPRNDILDGQKWTNQNTVTAQNDIAHYTNLHFRWDLEPAKKRDKAPEINVTDPNTQPFESINSNYFVRADIKNVQSGADVTAVLNGRELPFRYSRGKFGASCPLREGRNELKIHAQNLVGADDETVVIFWKTTLEPAPPAPVQSRPEVRFTNPGRSPFSTDKSEIYATAMVKNVRSKSEIRFFVNNLEENRFSFAEGFESNVRLREGRNTIRIEVKTEGGTASDEAEINVETRPILPKPTVRIEIANGANNPCGKTIAARTENVDRKERISVSVNNRVNNNWTFDSRRELVMMQFDLNPGRNIILVRVSNESGEAQDEETLDCINAPEPVGKSPVVTITTPRERISTTQNANATVKATILNIENKSEISFLVNGSSSNNFSFDSRTGLFSADFSLRQGDNAVLVRAANRAGEAEDMATIQFKKPLDLPKKPVVTISEPTKGRVFTDKNAKLVGRVEFVTNRSDIQVFVNNRAIPSFDFNKISGEVRADAELSVGENALKIIATNADGSADASVKCVFEGIKMPPEVTIISPKNGATTAQSDAAIEANITNVTSASGLQLMVNNKNIVRFQFSNGKLTANVALAEGVNQIIVRATNADGSDEAMSKITFSTAKNPPVVTIISPKTGATTETQNAKVEANITNVASSSGVLITVNGSAVGRFQFSGGNLSSTVNLREGENTIVVRGTNADGSDEQSVKILLKSKILEPSTPAPVPIEVPTINFTYPRRVGGKTNNGVEILKFSSKNVKNVAELTVTNGKKEKIVITDFDPKSGDGSVFVNLSAGENTFKIVATNKNGTASADTKINFEPKKVLGASPTVEIISATQPVTSPTQPNEARSTIVAKTTQIKERAQIKMTVNGVNFDGFQFDAGTGQIVGTIKLARGETKVIILVENAAGKASAERKIVF